MGWPTPQDYNEALQNPKYCFGDEELRSGTAELNALGLPRGATGTFASVYRFYCPRADYAVRCFLFDTPDQQKRYAEISKYILADAFDFTVDCEYLPQGVQVSRGQWYPLLKMTWVNGRTLDHYISESLAGNYATVSMVTLAEKFREMILLMQRDGIAHGDLQHGNILVLTNGDLRLVDYDGMYVPSLNGLASNELGHRNYQHPKRTADHYGPYLDNFSGWVIYLSLCALAIDASFWREARGGDDCLLFRKADFENPSQSHILNLLKQHPSSELRHSVNQFESLLLEQPDAVPTIDALLPLNQFARTSFLSRMAWNAKTLAMRFPEWMEKHKPKAPDHADKSAPIIDAREATPNVHQGKLSNAQPGKSSNLPDWIAEELGLLTNSGATSSNAKPIQAGSPPAPSAGSSVTSTIRNEKDLEKIINRVKNHMQSKQYVEAMLLLLEAENSPAGKGSAAAIRLLRLQAQIDLLQAEEYFSKRQLTAASHQYRKTMDSCAKLLSFSKTADPADLTLSADALNGQSSVLELRGHYEEALKAAKEYLQVLQHLPAVEMKKARARTKIVELEVAVKSSWKPNP